MKRERKKVGLNYILATIWLSCMALAGFHLPTFVDNLSFFKVKELRVEGAFFIPPDLFSKGVAEFKNNWLFITEEGLLRVLNRLTDNSIEEVKLERQFSRDGVRITLKVKERVPFLTAVSQDKVIFFDNKGETFFNPYLTTKEPYVYADDINLIKERFPIMKNLVSVFNENLDSIYLETKYTLIYTKHGKKIILPPFALIDEEALERAKKIYNIDIQVKEVDLRAGKMAIIKEEQE